MRCTDYYWCRYDTVSVEVSTIGNPTVMGAMGLNWNRNRNVNRVNGHGREWEFCF